MWFGRSGQDLEGGGLEISDLMVSLLAVFIIGVVAKSELISKYEGSATFAQQYVNEYLRDSLSAASANPNIEVSDTGVVHFRGKFETSKSELTDEIKVNLNEVCPTIQEVLIEFGHSIKHVYFEGHSSKYWEGLDANTPYYGNLDLSSWRAINVMRYCLGEKFEYEYPELLVKVVPVSYSYTRPILLPNGGPDWGRSKRVDIRVVTNE